MEVRHLKPSERISSQKYLGRQQQIRNPDCNRETHRDQTHGQASAVIRYIDTQEAHHRKRSYEQEIIALLKKHGVEYDAKYVLG